MSRAVAALQRAALLVWLVVVVLFALIVWGVDEVSP